ncbi:MAG: hypothetical protein LBM95_07820 [Lactobacillales bacterium]|jgi:hypothetical protein|nr:hypothetical protein [Lactobacillales bacterium]
MAMWATKSYPTSYVEKIQKHFEQQLSEFQTFSTDKKLEATFFENATIALEYAFVHRMRTVEGKNGNPLNELRMLAQSFLANDGIFTEDTLYKYAAEKSVLGYRYGEVIQLSAEDFELLLRRVIEEILVKFPE